MGCRGVHFAITPEEVTKLTNIQDGEERVEYIQEVIEEKYFTDHEEFLAESDKAWDAMHRALGNGTLEWEGGSYPLNCTIFGAEWIETDESYTISLKNPQQVKDLSSALQPITKEELRRRYDAIDEESYDDDLSEEDFEYTWHWFENVRSFYVRAAAAGRHVIFTVDNG